MATRFHDDEVVADSEEERELDLAPTNPPSRPEIWDAAPHLTLAATAALKDFLGTSDPMPPINDHSSSISSFTASRYIADTSISSIDATLPQVQATLTAATSIIESISVASSDLPVGAKKPRPRPKPRFRKPDAESTAPSTISSVSTTKDIVMPSVNTESVLEPHPSDKDDTMPTNLNRDISIIRSASNSKTPAVPALDISRVGDSRLSADQQRGPKGLNDSDIITISSDNEHDTLVVALPKKTKASHPKPTTPKVATVHPPEHLTRAGPSRPTENKKPRISLYSDAVDDDPVMLQKVIRLPPARVERSHSPSATALAPPAQQVDTGSDSDFNPVAAETKRKGKRKSKAAVNTDQEDEDANAPKKKSKGKDKKKASKQKSKGGGEDKELAGARASANMSRRATVTSKEFIEDSDDEVDPLASAGFPPGPQKPSPKRKREADDSSKPPAKKARASEIESINDSAFEVSRTQRSSVRVAIAKSVTEVAQQEPADVVEKRLEDKSQDAKRSKSKNAKDGQASAPKDADQADTPIREQTDKVGEKPGKKSKSKKQRTVVEVVLDARPSAPPIAVAVDPVLPPEPLQEPEPEPGPENYVPPPPASKHRVSDHVVAKSSRPSTPIMSTPTCQGRSSVPYWRRPNKPLTDILTQTTHGSQARPSGLHKRISIVPLHLNRKPPPPPLPPMPRKGKTLKAGAGSGSDDDDDETPKARLKRLAAEFEALEGMDSKKANDRRKEINEEMGRLAN
ncbi:hypothetical protein FRB95_011868 [Tulasnella sp. JGI-2019a]|nr:hypothetical protein FRB95_011868 [Tulasnella sp. JGI-2019a]